MRVLKGRTGIALLAMLLLTGCGGSGAGAPTTETTAVPTAPATAASSPVALASPAATAQVQACPSATGPIEDAIVVNRDFDLVGVAAEGQRVTPLTALPMGQGLRIVAPSWSPDGQTLAFTYFAMSPNPAVSMWLQVGMICGLDRQTGQGRTLAHPGSDLESYEEATWSPDGAALLVTHMRYLIADGVFQSVETNVARVDLASGGVTLLVREGSRPALSPDGQRLAYIQLLEGGYKHVLMVAQADGQQARPLLDAASPLGAVDAPRWSPDGQRLLFVASLPLSASLLLQEEPAPGAAGGWLDELLSVPVARAHGDPAYLWLASVDGQGLDQLNSAPLDDPRAAWSPDGQQIAYITTLGPVTLLDLASREQRALSAPGLAGAIDWRWR